MSKKQTTIIAGLCLLSVSLIGSTDAVAQETDDAVLKLSNGGFVSGELLGSDDPQVLQWRASQFTQPFQFPLGLVDAVNYPSPKKLPKPVGEYCFELSGDDVVYGALLGLNKDFADVDVDRVGRVRLRRQHIRRFYRWQGADLVYLGPSGLTGWKDTVTPSDWKDEGGHPMTDKAGASLFGDFDLPAKAAIEFEISWTKRPDFQLAVGVSRDVATVEHAYRFEVWDNDLVAAGESKRDADVASIQQVASRPGRMHVQALLDQEQRRLLLFSRGRPLATLSLQANAPSVHGGIRLTNNTGDVRLERQRITRWNGVTPRPVEPDKSRLHRTDGTIVYGQITAFDAEAKQFTVRNGDQDTLVSTDVMADVFLSRTDDESQASLESGDPATRRQIRVSYRDGSQFSGRVTAIDGTHLSLACPGIEGTPQLPLTELRSLVIQRPASGTKPEGELKPKDKPEPSDDGRKGRLELDGVRLQGRLISGTTTPDASCLIWKPLLALNESPLRPGVAGRIVYRERPKPVLVTPQSQQVQMGIRLGGIQAVRRPQGFGAVFKQLLTASVPAQPTAMPGKQSLHLRSGDTVPGEIVDIGLKGVTIDSPSTDTTFIPHDWIKAVDLTSSQSLPKLSKTKRSRLLTLPRLLRDSPPTHLLCSKNGDVLRARVLEMDNSRLKVEVRLETKNVPRNRVAQIIWLHADELSGETDSASTLANSDTTRVQAIRTGGNRLTFVASELDGLILSGESDVLGTCRVDLASVDELLFGTFIEQSAARLAYHRWRLHHATDPKFAQTEDGDDTGPRLTGMDSPLVGKPAADFELPLLEGGEFQLSAHKDRIVVLDFWATWCSPCLKTMPVLEEISGEFAEQGVELIAVNMEEQPAKIRSMLERHQLKVNVALDRDGVAAARYAVTALPHTVIVDRDGKVARVFIGGGDKLAEPFRAALQALTGGKPPEDEASPEE